MKDRPQGPKNKRKKAWHHCTSGKGRLGYKSHRPTKTPQLCLTHPSGLKGGTYTELEKKAQRNSAKKPTSQALKDKITMFFYGRTQRTAAPKSRQQRNRKKKKKTP